MKSTRLAVLIAPAASVLLSLPAASATPSNPPRIAEQATMQQLFRELSTVFRLTLDQRKFEDPANRDRILTSLYSFSGNAEQMVAHGETDNPSTDYFRRSLIRDADEAVMRFRQDQYEGTRFLVEQLINNCFGCHSRLPISLSGAVKSSRWARARR